MINFIGLLIFQTIITIIYCRITKAPFWVVLCGILIGTGIYHLGKLLIFG